MWDKRYAEPGYLFGTEPAAFLAREAGVIAPGARVLCLADGEGRNSVYLAGLGLDVVAMEASGVALGKARDLAKLRGVTVEFRQSGIEDWDWDQPFDAVVGVFIQFAPPAMRKAIHQGIARAVVPGGLVLLHGYAPVSYTHLDVYKRQGQDSWKQPILGQQRFVPYRLIDHFIPSSRLF